MGLFSYDTVSFADLCVAASPEGWRDGSISRKVMCIHVPLLSLARRGPKGLWQNLGRFCIINENWFPTYSHFPAPELLFYKVILCSGHEERTEDTKYIPIFPSLILPAPLANTAGEPA